jgi:Sulfotransferase family
VTRWPDFFIAGAPKAGTTALHAALTGVPGIALSSVKEPKYFLCAGGPPPRPGHRGPGDAHSRREWVWDQEHYLDLWRGAPEDALRGESTPFYLHDTSAQDRIAAVAPRARFIVMLRDPVDRAYSNWMHLWSDGLEPEASFLRAVEAEEDRRRLGWAPFWRYRGLGMYGEQLQHLYGLFPREQVLVLRYRDLVDEPERTTGRVTAFLGVEDGGTHPVPPDNTRPFRADTARNRVLARAVRAGAVVGSWLPPQAWRQVSRPLTRELHRQGIHRPALEPSERRQVLEPMLEDLDLLERLTGESFEDWRGDQGRGAFRSRSGAQASSVTRS